MLETVKRAFGESTETKHASLEVLGNDIVAGARLLSDALLQGHRILSCGNGGSACDAMHFSSELINRFEMERPGLPAVALTADSPTLTSIANDYDYKLVFARQVRALGESGDALLAITTSGNSANVIKAIQAAKSRGLKTIGMTGRGGELAACADQVIMAESDDTPRIQEAHITVGHILCELVDRLLYPEMFGAR